MLVIKFQRIGKKHQPQFRIVVAERRSKMKGPAVEDLGFYNSFSKQTAIDKDRAAYWLSVGAKPTVSAHNLLLHEGVIQRSKIAVRIRKSKGDKGTQPEKSAEAETKKNQT